MLHAHQSGLEGHLFSLGTLQARKTPNSNIKYLNCWKKKPHKLITLYPVKLSLKSKDFLRQTRIEGCVASRLAMQEMIEEIL